MKKLILSIALVAACAVAYGQGKVALVNDDLSLVTLSSDAGLVKAADASLKGLPVGDLTPLPSGVTLIAALFGGTTQANAILQTSVLLNGAIPAGNIPQTRVTLTGIGGIANGTAITAATPWFQVRIWDSAFTDMAAAAAGGSYVGQGSWFQMNPGPSIAYVLTAPAGANSTWNESPIVVGLVPEPTSFALLGLGAAAMLIFRRR